MSLVSLHTLMSIQNVTYITEYFNEYKNFVVLYLVHQSNVKMGNQSRKCQLERILAGSSSTPSILPAEVIQNIFAQMNFFRILLWQW